MASQRGGSKRHTGDQGAAAVEFALVATILVALLGGTIQFGFTFWEYIQVAHAAREGVRWAALGASGQAETRAEAAAPGLDPAKLTVVVEPSPGTYSVRVSATYPLTQLFPLPGIPLPETIQSVAEQRVE